jgi:GNAT superfamily N-acetyltransferase
MGLLMVESDEVSNVVLVDSELSSRLERTEGLANARFIESRQRQLPDAMPAPTWREVGSAFVMFDGVESPLTQSFGLGLGGVVTAIEFEEIEAFFHDRNAPVFLEVSPLASPETLTLLNERGYQPFEYTSVLCRRIGPQSSLTRSQSLAIQVRTIEAFESELFAQTSASGWTNDPQFREVILGFGRTFSTTLGTRAMIAEIDGKPIATGLVFIADDIALLAGASTVPSARNQGAQFSLLEARLQYAIAQGCKLAMMCALPGSPSQRNAQRNGFQIAYTRTKWKLNH